MKEYYCESEETLTTIPMEEITFVLMDPMGRKVRESEEKGRWDRVVQCTHRAEKNMTMKLSFF